MTGGPRVSPGGRGLPAWSPGQRIGLFGGSFNPPHEGHRLASLAALRRIGLDHVWWIVTPGNPLKRHDGLPDLDTRIAAARRMARHPRIAITGIEAGIGTRFTVDTIRFLKRRCPGVHFVWIMGADNLLQLPRWRRWRDLVDLVPVVAVDRPGSTFRSLHGRAAAVLAPGRLREADAGLLPDRRPPAFVYLHGPRSFASSTALRDAGQGLAWIEAVASGGVEPSASSKGVDRLRTMQPVAPTIGFGHDEPLRTRPASMPFTPATGVWVLSRPTVLMPNRMQPLVVEGLDRAVNLVKLWEADDREATLSRVAPDVGALAVGGHIVVDPAFLKRFPALAIVSNFGVGYDSIDATWAGQAGLIVTNTPGVLDEEVADTAMGLMLATVRQLPAAERHLRAGKWLEGAFPLSHTLRGRTVGILGLGRIGKAIAKRAEAFGLAVVYHGRRPQADVPYLYYPTLVGMAQACDILVIITPGGSETRNLVGAEVLKALGPAGILINVARGSVVDEAALIAALQDKTILGAGLDVFEEEPHVPQALLDLDHVVLLPHVGSASHHTRDAMGQLVVDNILAWAAGRPPLTPVIETPWAGHYRAGAGSPR